MGRDQDHHATFGRWIEIGGNPDRKEYGHRDYDTTTHSHRKPAWDSGKYRRAVLSQLRMVAANPVGKTVIGALTRKVIIIPHQDQEANNACVVPFGGDYGGDRLPVTKHVNPGSGEHDRLSQAQRDACRHDLYLNKWVGKGTGRGAEAVVEYTPGKFIVGSVNNPSNNAYYTADAVLLHELVHALRTNRGQLDHRAFSAPYLKKFKNTEEFMAVLIANMYRSANGVPDSELRGSYEQREHFRQYLKENRDRLKKSSDLRLSDMYEAGTDAFSFYFDYAPLVEALIHDLPAFCLALSRIDCKFNPLSRKVRGEHSSSIEQIARYTQFLESVKEQPFAN